MIFLSGVFNDIKWNRDMAKLEIIPEEHEFIAWKKLLKI